MHKTHVVQVGNYCMIFLASHESPIGIFEEININIIITREMFLVSKFLLYCECVNVSKFFYVEIHIKRNIHI